jgi:hypothetical protein
MNWYLAKLVYRIHYSDCGFQSEFDEQLRLITAEDRLHAFQKARLIGEKEEYSQLTNECSLVRWKFIDVCELHEMDTQTDGAEMYSQISAKENADTYIRTTRKKALYLYDQAVANFTGS